MVDFVYPVTRILGPASGSTALAPRWDELHTYHERDKLRIRKFDPWVMLVDVMVGEVRVLAPAACQRHPGIVGQSFADRVGARAGGAMDRYAEAQR